MSSLLRIAGLAVLALIGLWIAIQVLSIIFSLIATIVGAVVSAIISILFLAVIVGLLYLAYSALM